MAESLDPHPPTSYEPDSVVLAMGAFVLGGLFGLLLLSSRILRKVEDYSGGE